MKRRSFLKLSCGLGAGIMLSGLGLSLMPVEGMAQELKKIDKVKSAAQTTSICCYCAVGCGLICSTDKSTGKIIHIEGDPEHPVNEGSLCAKGAGIYQTTEANPHRLTKVLYRAPHAIKKERDASFMVKNKDGAVVNRLETVAHMGSSNIDSEECWNIAAFARSLGLVYLEHQARV